jgi:phosphoenolpyruvate---glycerone phosphotransferase subunit DhaL
MSSSVDATALIIKAMAEKVVESEDYFCKLDAVVGDGDMGYSLARGFEIILQDLDTYDRSNVGAFLKKVGFTVSSKIGGSSGPIWGTGFIRAAATAGDKTDLTPEDVIEMLRAAVEGIMQRGGASLGDKTLLDALVPAIDALEENFAAENAADDNYSEAIHKAARVCRLAAEKTDELEAKRGRASYTGSRSIGSPDAGAIAIAMIFENICRNWREKYKSEEGSAVAGG